MEICPVCQFHLKTGDLTCLRCQADLKTLNEIETYQKSCDQRAILELSQGNYAQAEQHLLFSRDYHRTPFNRALLGFTLFQALRSGYRKGHPYRFTQEEAWLS